MFTALLSELQVKLRLGFVWLGEARGAQTKILRKRTCLVWQHDPDASVRLLK